MALSVMLQRPREKRPAMSTFPLETWSQGIASRIAIVLPLGWRFEKATRNLSVSDQRWEKEQRWNIYNHG